MYLKVNFLNSKKSQKERTKTASNAFFLVFTYSFNRSYKTNSNLNILKPNLNILVSHNTYYIHSTIQFLDLLLYFSSISCLGLEEMCPLRFLLIFFSALLAAYFAWTTVSSTTPEIDFAAHNHDDKSSSNEDHFSFVKVLPVPLSLYNSTSYFVFTLFFLFTSFVVCTD